MPNANRYPDGLSFLLFPGNYSQGTAGYNFPESTAQDIHGSLSLSFSGSRLPFSTQTANAPLVGFYRGPSGFLARYTTLALPTGGNYQNFSSVLTASNKFGAPNLREIFGVNNNYNVEIGTDPTDNGVRINQRFRDGRAFNTVGQIEVLDLISEGPIEGFVSGIYEYSLSGKTTGDIGYASAKFRPYSTNYIYSAPETRSIYWNDVPITDLAGFYNFQYVDYKYTYGEKTNDHTVYNPYLNLHEYRTDYFGNQVDKNKIPLETSVTTFYNERIYGFYTLTGSKVILNPKTYYIYNTQISSIKINIQINSLFEQIMTGSNAGNVERQYLDFKFALYRVLENGNLVILDTSKYQPFIQDYYSRDTIGAEGKIQNSPVIITYTFNIRPFAENAPSFDLLSDQIGWAVDITKMTLESTTASLASNTEVLSITQVYSDRFVYPDSALVFSKFDARYFSDIPSRSYKVRLLKVKVPINYDPIVKKYNGPWNGKFKVAWTDNPAWCFYDIISNNRYGLGKYINSELTDKWTLYEIAQYCDQLVSDGFGGLEPRFTCNLYIGAKEEAMKVLNDMASIFLAILYYSAGQISVAQDSPKDPIYLFNNTNVLNGEFSYSDSSKKSRKTVATVRYNDKYDNYKPAIEYVEDKDSIFKYGIRETEIVAFGCTSKNQARRVGKWLLTTDNLQTEVIEFSVGLEGNYLRPGDIISVYDQYRKNKAYAGRTMELTTGYAILDLPYNFTNTYAITGVNVNNSFDFEVITPTYNFNFGTNLSDLYITGFSPTTSGVSGLNSSFIRRSQIQSINISNPKNYITSGSGIYSNNIRINFPRALSISGYTLPQNTVWSIDLSTTGYSSQGINTLSPINNDSLLRYPGYYLESYLNKPKNYRILNISQKQDEIFVINGLEHNDKKYTDIDNASILVNKPIRPNLPDAPSLFLSGIFRNSAGSYLVSSAGNHYVTNQGGINSIMYNIIPNQNNNSNNAYYIYLKRDTNFDSASETPENFLYNTISHENLRTGIAPRNWIDGTIPPFLTPTGIGNYFFRIFAANQIGERSSPASGVFNLTTQASADDVIVSGRNIY